MSSSVEKQRTKDINTEEHQASEKQGHKSKDTSKRTDKHRQEQARLMKEGRSI